MKKLLLLASVLPQFLFAQDFQSQFYQALNEKDSLKKLEVLENWKASSPVPPAAEYYAAAFNYHVNLARTELLEISPEAASDEAMTILDSNGNVEGYIHSRISYDEAKISEAIILLDEGLNHYPNRLDLHFGKIYVLGQTQNWGRFTSAILNTIDYSKEIDNQWLWEHNSDFSPTPQEDFLGSMQDYQLQLYNTEDDALMTNMRAIANKILEHYPDHTVSLSNLALTYMVEEKWDQAIASLDKARSLDEADMVIVANLAHSYRMKGDTNKAREYYLIMRESDDLEIVDFAEYMLEQLEAE